VWPLGLPGWADPWLAVGLRGERDTLLTVFRRPGGSDTVELPLPWLDQPTVETVFPTALTPWSPSWTAGTLTLTAPPGPALQARTFRLT
jgi:alpha-galactosidase